MTSTAVRVGLRVRPLTPKEQLSNCTECLSLIPNEPQILIGTDKSFTYDYVFRSETSQQEVYDTAAAPLLKKFMDGFNATILAYGQTGSGKTYSMGTGLQNGVSPGNEGIVPRCIMDLFKTMQEREKENPEYKYEIYVSFLELYNEELVDLLNPQTAQRRKSVAGLNSTGSTEITIREDVAGNIYWSGVREERCYSPEDLLGYLAKGSLCRTTGSTDMNTVSSRSHAIFSVILKQQQPAGSGENGDSKPKSLTSKFHFVDLAGSERLKRTNAQGDRAKEGIAINSGLLALGNVISALGDESRRATHIPYRDSKLTRLLQDSLGGNSQTMMLACVSPADSNFMETLNTLKYANRARNITNRVVINQDFAGNSIEINQLRAQIARLRMEVASLRAERRGDNAGGSSVAAAAAVSDESNKALRAEVSRLRDRIQDMSANLIQVTSERDTLLLERDLNEFMKGESAMDDLTGSSLDQNKQLSTHPLIMQYQKTIQDLNNELQDCKDRIAFLEATKGATMQAVMMANSSLQRSMAHQQQEKQQPSRSNSGTTHHRRRKSHNRRNAGRMSRSNSSTTIHMARRTTGHSAKRQYVKQSASSSVTRQRRQLSVKFQDEEDDYSDDDDIRAEVKSSIAKAREEIQRGMQVLNLIKPLQGLAEEDAWEKELKDFAEAESRQQQSGQESDDTRGSSPDEGSSTAADQDLLGDELLDEIEYLAVPSWDDPVKASSESTVDNEATATDDSSKAAVPQILSQASVVTRKNDPQLARMLHQIQSDIKVKEELVSHLEKSETEYAFMRRKFDDKISQLQQQLLELQQERDGALARTKSRASKMEAAAQLKEKQHLIDIRHSYENKMKGLLAEIQDLKRKYSQTTMNMQATRNQHEALLRSLKVNVETLKLEKKRLLKRIKQETARMREEQTLKERKIQQLQRLNAEANIARKRLEKQHEQQKQALKRRDEEVLINSTQLKQLTEVLKRAVREGGVLDERLLGKVSHIIGGRFALFARGRRGGRLSSRKRKNSIPLHIRVNRKKELLDGALYQYIQGKQAVVEMEELLLRREQLAAEKLELLEERKHMYIAEKEIAEATGHPMDTMALDMTDERIDMIGAEISYLSARIRALQTEALGEAEVADCAAAAAAAAQQQQRLEKRVTFADDILTDTPGPSDDWADMDALEEQYAVPPIAAPEIAYDATMRLLKSLETDEARAIAQALAEDIMTLRMSEANNKAMMQNMEKTVEDLRRTLIVMKRAAITTTVENERRIRKLEERNQKSNSRYSVEDANSIDASVEEYINSGNTIFDKIYEDGIRGVISAPESSLDYLSDSRRSSIVSFGGTSANGSNDEAFIPPPSPLTSPTYVLGQSARAASSNSTVPSSGLKPPVSLLDKNGRGNLYSNREGTPSPERFLKMVQQRRFSWQHRRGSIAESPTPFSTMTPTDFARYEAEVETSTSSIHSNHLRRSSIQSDYSTSSMRKRAYSLQQQQPGRLPDGYDGPLSPPPTATFSVQQQQRWQAPPLPPPRRPRLGP